MNRTRDAEIIRLLRLRDQEGLAMLVADYGARIQGALHRKYCGALDAHEIEDAVYTAFLRVWRLFDTYREEFGSLRSWLFQVARNCALRVIENRRRVWPRAIHSVDWDLLPAQPLDGADSSENLAVEGDSTPSGGRAAAAAGDPAEEVLRQFHRAIANLGPLQRSIMMADLEFGGSASARELAHRFGTTTNTIYASRSAGRRVVREHLGRCGMWPTDSGVAPTQRSSRVDAGSVPGRLRSTSDETRPYEFRSDRESEKDVQSE